MKHVAVLILVLTVCAADASGQGCTVQNNQYAGQTVKQECAPNSAGNAYVIVVEQSHTVTWSGTVGGPRRTRCRRGASAAAEIG